MDADERAPAAAMGRPFRVRLLVWFDRGMTRSGWRPSGCEQAALQDRLFGPSASRDLMRE